MDLSTGQVVRTIGRGNGSDLDQFSRPCDVALDGHGNLLVVGGNDRVVVWNTSDNTLTSFSTPAPSFLSPHSLCVDSKGNVIVGGHYVAVWSVAESIFANFFSLFSLVSVFSIFLIFLYF